MQLAVSPEPFGEALRARDRRNAASARSPVSSGGGTDTTCVVLIVAQGKAREGKREENGRGSGGIKGRTPEGIGRDGGGAESASNGFITGR
jgi:hypothetical protein